MTTTDQPLLSQTLINAKQIRSAPWLRLCENVQTPPPGRPERSAAKLLANCLPPSPRDFLSPAAHGVVHASRGRRGRHGRVERPPRLKREKHEGTPRRAQAFAISASSKLGRESFKGSSGISLTAPQKHGWLCCILGSAGPSFSRQDGSARVSNHSRSSHRQLQTCTIISTWDH
ncbi:hypothetical protein LX36DRAFT_382559 [Colletotrichum falcatum]|nr:hypothetical protein LX36DRAFT_382559 [Colletotrichum falcatum]